MKVLLLVGSLSTAWGSEAWLATRALEKRVTARYVELFGERPEEVWANSWGRVSLPVAHRMTAAEIQLEWEDEGLDTEERRQKAITDWGPSEGGVPIYAHFTGADDRFSDAWGTETTITELMTLARGWFAACKLRWGASTCTLQVGDIGWYSDLRPDPLGHADHHKGDCVDIRLFRDDGSHYEALWNRPDDRPGRGEHYSAERTAAFIEYARAHHPVTRVIFNDPAIEGVDRARNHDDHVHLCF